MLADGSTSTQDETLDQYTPLLRYTGEVLAYFACADAIENSFSYIVIVLS